MTLSPQTLQPMPGDPVPGFITRSPQNPRYSFDSAAWRWLVLCVVGSAADAAAQGALKAVAALTGDGGGLSGPGLVRPRALRRMARRWRCSNVRHPPMCCWMLPETRPRWRARPGGWPPG
jgi:hypothetical protein